MSLLKSLSLKLEAESVVSKAKKDDREKDNDKKKADSAASGESKTDILSETKSPSPVSNCSAVEQSPELKDVSNNSNNGNNNNANNNKSSSHLCFKPLVLSEDDLQDLDVKAKKISDYLKNNDNYPQIFFFYVKPTYMKFLQLYLTAWAGSMAGAFISSETTDAS
jgi:hypothetical protein